MIALETCVQRMHTLERRVADLDAERAALVAATHQLTAQNEQLVLKLEHARIITEAAQRMRDAIPVESAEAMRGRGFHPTTCDLVEVVDAEREVTRLSAQPYRDYW